jgi:hypothetical protein
MLLDIGSVLGGIGLAVVAFIVVIAVCVLILRLLAVILPSYEEASSPGETSDEPVTGDAAAAQPLSAAPQAEDAPEA